MGLEEAPCSFWLCSKINKAVFNFHAFPCGMFLGLQLQQSSMVPKAAIAAAKTKAITMTHTPTANSGGHNIVRCVCQNAK